MTVFSHKDEHGDRHDRCAGKACANAQRKNSNQKQNSPHTTCFKYPAFQQHGYSDQCLAGSDEANGELYMFGEPTIDESSVPAAPRQVAIL